MGASQIVLMTPLMFWFVCVGPEREREDTQAECEKHLERERGDTVGLFSRLTE